MFLKPAALVTLSALLLTVISLYLKASSIEDDILQRVSAELNSKGYGWAVVKIDGRNVELVGTAPNQSFQSTSTELADNVWGVFRVKSNMDVAVKSAQVKTKAPQPTPPTSAVISEYITKIKFGDGQIVLKGSVPNAQLKKEIVFLAKSLDQGSQIIDDLVINSMPPNNWRLVFGLGFSQISRLQSGEMVLENNVVRITGLTWSSSAIKSIQNILNAGLPDPYLAELSLKKIRAGSALERNQCQAVINDIKENTRIFFDTDSARIKRKSFALLDKMAYTLRRCSELKVRIEGHTDNRGDGTRNWRLSKDRAENVKGYLVRSGLNEKRIYTRGYGEARPIANNKDASGRAANRRIELFVTNSKFIDKKGS